MKNIQTKIHELLVEPIALADNFIIFGAIAAVFTWYGIPLSGLDILESGGNACSVYFMFLMTIIQIILIYLVRAYRLSANKAVSLISQQADDINTCLDADNKIIIEGPTFPDLDKLVGLNLGYFIHFLVPALPCLLLGLLGCSKAAIDFFSRLSFLRTLKTDAKELYELFAKYG